MQKWEHQQIETLIKIMLDRQCEPSVNLLIDLVEQNELELSMADKDRLDTYCRETVSTSVKKYLFLQLLASMLEWVERDVDSRDWSFFLDTTSDNLELIRDGFPFYGHDATSLNSILAAMKLTNAQG